MLDSVKKIVVETNSWRDAKKRLKDAKIELSAEQLLDALEYWQKHMASKLTKEELLSELVFWADGGSFETHLQGFDAIKPKVLAYEAKNRDWTVLSTSSGDFVVNPPEMSPIVLRDK